MLAGGHEGRDHINSGPGYDARLPHQIALHTWWASQKLTWQVGWVS